MSDLRTEWADRPLAVSSPRPTFSWLLSDDRHGAEQQSYRIRLTADDDQHRQIWDSGVVTSDQSFGIRYDGPPLTSRSRYHWDVAVGNDQDQLERSSATWFETAIGEADWDASWIASGQDSDAAPIFRRELRLKDAPVRARLYVCGLGIHRCAINGLPVTDSHLESGLTAFDKTVLFSTYDVTEQLDAAVTSSSDGVALSVELGRGFYAMSTPNVWRWDQPPWKDRLRLRYRLEVTYTDNTTDIVVSDPSWSWRQGPTRFDSMYEGETFDARENPAGWQLPDFDDTQWAPAVEIDAPRGTLRPQELDPIRVVDELQPSWHQQSERVWVADFTDTIAGWARLRTDAPVGSTIVLTYGEQLKADGTVAAENQHVKTDRFQRDEFISAGDSSLVWESRFSYKGFRYVQVDNIGDPSELDLVGCHAHSDVRGVSAFDSSHQVLNWIDRAMRLTVSNNLHHIPTDTPIYEKNGWTGDAQVGTESMLSMFDMNSFFAKWLGDMADSQRDDGQLPVIIPTSGWGYTELAPAAEWTTIYPFLLYQLSTWYGNAEVTAVHLEAVIRYLDWEIERLEDDLVTGVLGDYLAPGFGGPPDDDLRISGSCYVYRALMLTAELAERAGLADRSAQLVQVAQRISTAVNATFLDTEAGLYRGVGETYRQTSNILPLAMGLVPEAFLERVVANLVADIHAHDDHHNTGCLGASQILRVLSAHGHADLAMRIATQTTRPSWGAWYLDGETTMREMWGEESRSHDHYFMGTPAQWLYESVAGITMLEDGWSAFAVNPVARAGLDHASWTYDSVRGRLGAAWQQTQAGFRLKVTVPVGARALVSVPTRDKESVAIDPETPAIDGAGTGAQSAQVEGIWVPSGEWTFTSSFTPVGKQG